MFGWCGRFCKAGNSVRRTGISPSFPAFELKVSLWTLQSEQLAQHIVQRVPAASIAALCATLAAGSPAAAADFFQQPQQPQSGAPTQTQQSGSPQTMDFQGSKTENAPAVSKMLSCFAVSLSAAAGLLVKTTDFPTAGSL
jgi:hypothetical protein